ncbi:MAG TPA: sulfatase-like hydrolase/transferase [Spirochaetia bacterium]|nr:sulfatase-like hydrolase/transferase [Spirochaetia bacterium]
MTHPSDNASVSRPNILWICTDQQRFDTIAALGNPHIRTPNLDRLCSQGTAFSRAYCQSPICTPSRASFLTGMYPSTVHGCMNGNERWSGAAPLVTKLLADAGYRCGLVGKLHLAGIYAEDGTLGRMEPRGDDGYEYFQWSPSPMDRWKSGHDYADWLKAKGKNLGELTTLTKGDNYTELEPGVPAELHQTTWCAEKAAEFIEESAGEDGRPWLLSVNPFDPHPPFNPPSDYLKRYDVRQMPLPVFRETDFETQRRLEGADFQTECRSPEDINARLLIAAYYAMVELIDWNIGRMLEILEETGQSDNTVILFTSDHGEALGDHGLLLKGCRFYEGLARVPLVFSWPAKIRKALVSPALVELTDIAPTLLDLCGLDTPERMQGRSLLPILTGEAAPDRHRDLVRCEYFRALNPDYRPKFEGTYANMVFDGRYKLSVYHGHEYGELYDIEKDPREFTNLWEDSEFAALKCRMIRQCLDALAFAVDPGPEQTVKS